MVGFVKMKGTGCVDIRVGNGKWRQLERKQFVECREQRRFLKSIKVGTGNDDEPNSSELL